MPKTPGAPKKPRWTPAQKAKAKARKTKSSPSAGGFARAERPRRDDDRPRRFESRDDRPKRFESRDDRPRRFESRDDRPKRYDSRDDRPRRFDSRDDGPRRPRRSSHGERTHAVHRHPRPEPRRAFEDAEAARAEADTWTTYTASAKGGPAEVTADNGFAGLGLADRLVERLARDGITDPFPIQAATIPDALAGRDVLGRGRTGSGKTLAFGLPTISRLVEQDRRAQPTRPRALILVPTRELAMQVSDALQPFVHVSGLSHRLVAGGLSYEPQISALRRGVDLLIATPGRLQDLLERGAVHLDDVEVTILDEADHMADMGFLPEVTAILDLIPDGGQRLLFSATLDRGVDTLVERYLVDPVTHSVDEAQAAVTTMSHHVLLIDPQEKKALTAQLACRSGRVIIFARTQLGADRIAGELRERGVLAAAMHGGLTQAVRNRVLGAFRDNTIPVLVATDVAARGIHVDEVSLVLQVDPPRDHKDYLHRSGRTARAGEEGTVVMFALPHQRGMVTKLVQQAGADATITRTTSDDATIRSLGGQVPSGEPVPDDAWRPILEGRRTQRGGPRGHRGPRVPREGGRPRRSPGPERRPRRGTMGE